MSVIRERIKSNNQDTNIKINLSIGNRLSGYQQEIDSFTEETKVELINPVVDNEVRRFEYFSNAIVPIFLLFEFSENGSIYSNSFESNGAGFSLTEIQSYDIKILNSFFIMDFFDTFDNNTQIKIFTIYNTQILDGEKSGSTPIPKYKIYSNTRNQFYCWYVPKSFIDLQTGSTATGYVKFSFYNAKSGKLALFNNKAITDPLSLERMYFKVNLNLDTMKWEFDDIVSTYTARQIPSTSAYAQKVNNAINNFENIRQNPPTGAFDSEDGTYED